MTSRLEYTLEYIAKRHLEELDGLQEEDKRQLSLEEISIIEESLYECKMIADSCLASECESCDRYMTHDCVRNLLNNKLGDDWCEDLLSSEGESIDDYLEMKRHG